MTLDEAIEILSIYDKQGVVTALPDFHDAVKLGREALKRLQEQRSGTILDEYDLLPGETKD